VQFTVLGGSPEAVEKFVEATKATATQITTDHVSEAGEFISPDPFPDIEFQMGTPTAKDIPSVWSKDVGLSVELGLTGPTWGDLGRPLPNSPEEDDMSRTSDFIVNLLAK
jgi:hypothetical protein